MKGVREMARNKITKLCDAPYWPLQCSEGVFGGDACVVDMC